VFVAGVQVHACATFPFDEPSALHDLARAFRAGDEAAFEAAVALVEEALLAGIVGLDVADGRPASAVAVPGHRAGAVNGPCERLIQRLTEDLDWVRNAPGVLERIADAPEGKAGPDRNATDEAKTLRWRADGLAPDGPVILLDDIVRSGATLQAAILAAPPDLAFRLVPVAVFRAVPSTPGSGHSRTGQTGRVHAG
jgi:hypothetical protein